MDIVTHCKVPRYLHNDLPLGNPLGKPYDKAAQEASVRRALAIAAESRAPVVEVSSLRWAKTDDWKAAYGRVDNKDPAQLLAQGEATRRRQAEEKAQGIPRYG